MTLGDTADVEENQGTTNPARGGISTSLQKTQNPHENVVDVIERPIGTECHADVETSFYKDRRSGRDVEALRGDSHTVRMKVNMWQVMYPLTKPSPAYAKKYSHLRLNVAYSAGSASDG